MEDRKLAVDEARRVAQHEAVKSKVEAEVNAEITGRAASPKPGEAEKIDKVAEEFRGRAVHETVATEHAVGRARSAARGSQFIDYLFYLIYGLLAVRLVLGVIAAQSSSGFVQFIRTLTGPLYAPFRGIVPSPTVEGGYTFALPIVIAIAAYMLLHLAINGFLRMVVHRKTEI